VSLIVLGNIILVNLFLAILFGNFETDEIDEALKTKRREEREKTRSSMIMKSIEGPLRGRSLYIFNSENVIRKFCYRIISLPHFDG
jgi:hypothetical protein